MSDETEITIQHQDENSDAPETTVNEGDSTVVVESKDEAVTEETFNNVREIERLNSRINDLEGQLASLSAQQITTEVVAEVAAEVADQAAITGEAALIEAEQAAEQAAEVADEIPSREHPWFRGSLIKRKNRGES